MKQNKENKARETGRKEVNFGGQHRQRTFTLKMMQYVPPKRLLQPKSLHGKIKKKNLDF